jgi:hypothetical protein
VGDRVTAAGYSGDMYKLRKAMAAFSLAGLMLTGAACSDDDGDGNPEVDVPQDVDVDVDQGQDNKGD